MTTLVEQSTHPCIHTSIQVLTIHPSLVIQTFALGEEISRELARLKLGEGYIKVYLRTIHLFVFK